MMSATRGYACYLLLAAFAALGAHRAVAAPVYTVTPLPFIQATAISNSGQVIAGAGAVWTSQGGVQSIVAAGYSFSDLAINPGGATAGAAFFEDGSSPYGSGSAAAAVVQNGRVTILPALSNGGYASAAALALNNSGTVVGVAGASASPLDFQAVRWSNGVAEDLAHYLEPGQSSAAVALNDAGQVVLVRGARSDSPQSFLLTGSQLQPIADMSVDSALAAALNSAGVAAGSATRPDGTSRAFSWSNGHMHLSPQLVGSTGSLAAMAINDAGTIVGYSARLTASAADFRAIVWDGGDSLLDLNELIDSVAGWTLYAATEVNDDGEIVGNGAFNGVPMGFVLTPVGADVSTTSTPEPASALLLAPAFILLCHPRRFLIKSR